MANITFVDENDTVIGAGTKTEAIEKGIVHRIVRIFLFNSKGELLIQKRGGTVLAGRWDHSAAGHVDEGEDYLTAAYRELEEEVGVTSVELKEVIKIYTEEADEPKLKKRFNVLYTAAYDGEVRPDPHEVQAVRWIQPAELLAWIEQKPLDFTEGFIRAFQELVRLKVIAI